MSLANYLEKANAKTLTLLIWYETIYQTHRTAEFYRENHTNIQQRQNVSIEGIFYRATLALAST